MFIPTFVFRSFVPFFVLDPLSFIKCTLLSEHPVNWSVLIAPAFVNSTYKYNEIKVNITYNCMILMFFTHSLYVDANEQPFNLRIIKFLLHFI